MKKLLFILFLALTLHQTCSAKDSTLVFKFAAGINYYNPINTNGYNTLQANHFSSSSSSLSFKDTAGISFIIKVGVQKQVNKVLGFDLSLSYSTNKSDYTTTATSSDYDVYSHTGSDASITDYYVVKQQNFALSPGLMYYIHQFYIMPKFDMVYIYYPATITSTNTIRVMDLTTGNITSNSTINTSDKTKTNIFTTGTGMAIGYNFRIRKKILSLELQSDYYVDNTAVPVAMMNRINASFLVGFAF